MDDGLQTQDLIQDGSCQIATTLLALHPGPCIVCQCGLPVALLRLQYKLVYQPSSGRMRWRVAIVVCRFCNGILGKVSIDT